MIIFGHRLFHFHAWVHSEPVQYSRFTSEGVTVTTYERYSKRTCWCGVLEHLEGKVDGIDHWVRFE